MEDRCTKSKNGIQNGVETEVVVALRPSIEVGLLSGAKAKAQSMGLEDDVKNESDDNEKDDTKFAKNTLHFAAEPTAWTIRFTRRISPPSTRSASSSALARESIEATPGVTSATHTEVEVSASTFR
ncbi:hypothetical protein BV898_07006 [Hypsibius exemplaris]|uniref:Uncharacterized protein n=1 Tax=Hypsibius exemplaris TaxID=2072580 RepID=A0A1W0WUW5_HYPEX|nr:hypothetical protein BV898_07006 [Hypsibius exemplaris]